MKSLFETYRPLAAGLFVVLQGCCLLAIAALPEDRKPAGWAGDPDAPAGKAEPDSRERLTPAEQKRYDTVGLALVTAINAGDTKAYRALFSDEGWESSIDWWRDMFAVQTKRFGRIEKAWAPARGLIRVGKMGVSGEGSGAGMLVKFEEPVGGLLSFTLDEKNLIIATSVFVKEELGYAEPQGLALLYGGK